jgi:tRNA (mo5U34)-methyltransferase
MVEDEILKKIDSVPFWWHPIRLGSHTTPGQVGKGYIKFIEKSIPLNLKGKTVLDVGAWDGYFSFLAERRGARKVLAIDNLQNRDKTRGRTGFEVAKEVLNSRVDYEVMDVRDIDRLEEEFDVIFFFGVYYHLEDPYTALVKLQKKCRELMIMEGYVIEDTRSIMKFFFDYEVSTSSSTDFWGASVPCLIKMCKRAGFKHAELFSRYRDRAIIKAWNKIDSTKIRREDSYVNYKTRISRLLALGLRAVASRIEG